MHVASLSCVARMLCGGFAVLPLVAAAQVLVLTGDPTATLNYAIYPSPGFVEAFVTPSDPNLAFQGIGAGATVGATSLPSLSPGQLVGMSLNFVDSTTSIVSSTVCGSGCYSQQLNGTGVLSIKAGSATAYSDLLGNTAAETSEIFAVPGSNAAVLQLALKTSAGVADGYLIFSGGTSSTVELCAASFSCVPTNVSAGSFFNNFTLSPGWTATIQAGPYAVAISPQVQLNPAMTGQQNLSWSSNQNWLRSGAATIPTAGDDVSATSNSANATSITFDATIPVASALHSLTLDATNVGTITFNHASGVLSFANETIGLNGTGTYVQSGNSTNNVSGTLTLAAIAGSTGSYLLQGGSLNAGTININPGGSLALSGGAVNFTALNVAGQSAGFVSGMPVASLTASGDLFIATTSSPTSTIHQTGMFDYSANVWSSQTVVPGTLVIGADPGTVGHYNLDGGSLTAGALVVAQNAGATGNFQLTSGTLNAGTATVNSGGTVQLNVGQVIGHFNADTVTVNSGGTFQFNGGNYGFGQFNAGTVTVNSGGTFQFNGGAPNFGQFNLNTGAVASASGDEVLDTDDQSHPYTFTQSGTASNTVTGALVIGANVTGTYQLQGGTLTATNIVVGSYGTGYFAQAGGDVTSTGALSLGLQPGASGTYSLMAGSLTAASENVGGGSPAYADPAYTDNCDIFSSCRLITPPGGSGAFTQSGITSNTVGVLTVAANPGSIGTYNLNGGTLNAGSENVGGIYPCHSTNCSAEPYATNASGSFKQSGNSTNNVSGTLTLAAIAGSTGSYLLQGGSLNAGTININPGGMFQLNGGAITANSLTIQPGGSFAQSGGGTVVTGAASNSGTLTVTMSTLASSAVFTNTGNVTVGAGGILNTPNYRQLAGVTLLDGGTLDPVSISVLGGAFGGNGTVIGNTSVANATISIGGTSSGVLRFVGNFVQTSGEITFAIASNGSGSFLTNMLRFDPQDIVSIANTGIVLDFMMGTDPLAFLTSDQSNVSTFFSESDQSAFNRDALMSGNTFAFEVGVGPTFDLSYDPNTGDLTPGSAAPVPEVSIAWLMLSALGLLGVRNRFRTAERLAA